MKRKYDRIAATIVADIEAGKFEDRLPGVRTLAIEYKTNFKTAARAVRHLAEQGTVRPERGLGARIIHGRREDLPEVPLVAIYGPHTGHFHGDLAARLRTGLRRAGFATFFPELGDLFSERMPLDDLLAAMGSRTPTALAIAGGALFPYEELYARQDNLPRLLFLSRTNGIEFNADYVLSDAWLGAYQATRYLLDLGHRRIMMIMPKWRPPPAVFRFSEYHDQLIGFRAALEEYGASDGELLVHEDLPADITCEAAVREALTGPERPTAVFAVADFRCVRVYRVARELGLQIPRDLSVIGYLDTPWSRQLSPQLTSVSVNPAEIAAEVVRRLTYNGPRRSRCRIAPTLVHRDSCAPAPVNG